MSDSSALAATTTSEGFYTRINTPEVASAATRHTWDLFIKQPPDLVRSPQHEISSASTPDVFIADSTDVLEQSEQTFPLKSSQALVHSNLQASLSQWRAGSEHGGLGVETHVQPSSTWPSLYNLRGRGASPECQAYIMHLCLDRTPLNSRGSEEHTGSTGGNLTFRLMLDTVHYTGSNTTWLLGHRYCEGFKHPDPSEPQTPAEGQSNDGQGSAMHETDETGSRSGESMNSSGETEVSSSHVNHKPEEQAPATSREKMRLMPAQRFKLPHLPSHRWYLPLSLDPGHGD